MFGKKKSSKPAGLPELPPSMRTDFTTRDYGRTNLEPSPVEPNSREERHHGLPSFPDSPMRKGFSQSAIKDAVETPGQEDLPELPSFQENNSPIPKFPEGKSRTIELEEWEPTQIPQEKPMQAPPQPAIANRPPQDRNKPIFVKLEKFKEARESLEIVKEKLGEMDELLKLIKEVKEKENQEIMEWEREIEKVKARINSVNTNIFENAF